MPKNEQEVASLKAALRKREEELSRQKRPEPAKRITLSQVGGAVSVEGAPDAVRKQLERYNSAAASAAADAVSLARAISEEISRRVRSREPGVKELYHLANELYKGSAGPTRQLLLKEIERLRKEILNAA